jgi:lipopolysaccharide biosynthesis regulator YciM
MAKPSCEVGKKKLKARKDHKARYKCKECGLRMKKKIWVCEAVKL